LSAAFSAKVMPVSSGSGRPRSPAETAATPKGAMSSCISLSLPALCVAMTILPSSLRAMVPPRSHHGHLLQVDELGRACPRKLDESKQCVDREGLALCRALHLDEPARAGDDEIGVGLCGRILGIVEIEHGRARIDAAGDGGDMVLEGLA